MDLNNWKYVRTIDPIESSFAILRHRTIRSKGYLSNSTALAIVFKLLETARNAGGKLDGSKTHSWCDNQACP